MNTASVFGAGGYDLEADPRETTDLAPTRPEKLADLRATLEVFHAGVQADEPVWPPYLNSHYEDLRIEWPAYLAKPLVGQRVEPPPH